MLRAGRIHLVFIEVIFSEMYRSLPSFAQIYQLLVSRGFLLVSFYRIYYREQLARETDALFVLDSSRWPGSRGPE